MVFDFISLRDTKPATDLQSARPCELRSHPARSPTRSQVRALAPCRSTIREPIAHGNSPQSVVELVGIEPTSSDAETGLLRVQSIKRFLGPGAQMDKSPTGSATKKSQTIPAAKIV